MEGLRLERSRRLYEEALNLFPGGVNSPVRAAVKPHPFYVERGEGAYLYTVDGERLVDLVLGYGPLILGHRHPRVLEALREAIERGWLYGAPAEAEVELARAILRHVKPGGMIRFVNSGTEATMTAIRLARGYTGRRLILKFEGNYHGSHDAVLVAAGSAAGHYGVPTSAGVPGEVARLTLVAPYNDLGAVEEAFRRHGDDIAAVIVEPVAANMGVVRPVKGFLEGLRRITREYGALLILDEVVTGFRLGLGGAQERFGVEADIVTLGKIIGGGMPIGAVAGRREIMEHLTPKGKVFNAGTFNAHPLAMAAGLATIKVLEETDALSVADRAAERLEAALRDALRDSGVEGVVVREASMLQYYTIPEEPRSLADVRRSDARLYQEFHVEALRRGVFVAPSHMEAIFTSAAHAGEPLEHAEEALYEALRAAVGRRAPQGGG